MTAIVTVLELSICLAAVGLLGAESIRAPVGWRAPVFCYGMILALVHAATLWERLGW